MTDQLTASPSDRALGGLLFGYDTAVISGAIGFLQTHFALTAAMKGWTAACALLGCVLGAALAGTLSDRFGRRNTLIVSAVLFLVSAIGTAVPSAPPASAAGWSRSTSLRSSRASWWSTS